MTSCPGGCRNHWACGPWAGASTTPCAWPRLVPTEWVLCDIQMHALAHGFAQGLAHLWAQDGTLLATASQSISVRRWPGDNAVVAGAALSKSVSDT